ncbi:putative UDP-glucuronosyl/UDP-glucosyltransferase, Glycosyltransferase family 28 [Septoria linicola]|nr:putative UDP-glucuronosyl/UDP-glucosyltransferase, Glycosyltransferase family 28 [Septoria linicola]
MATPLASQRLERTTSAGTPARLTTLPTDTLPGVDFSAHLHENGHNGVVRREEVEEPLGTHDSDLADEAGQSDDTVKSNSTSSRQTDAAPAGSTLKRASTAPASRPKAIERSGTLLNAVRRKQHPYQYQFDPMSSDSDTSSSEEETRKATTRPKRLKRVQSAAQQKEDKQLKEDSKKGRSFSRFHLGNDQFRTKGKVSKRDGRLNISVNETANNGYLAKALGHSIKHHLDIPNRRSRKQRRYDANHPDGIPEDDAESVASDTPGKPGQPRLNIVIIIIGSRGDIQPFLKVGKILKEEHGHRVRIATHPTFRDFVEKESGLEFFSIGGNPSELMAFMVKNPGLIPNLQTIREGEVKRRRDGMAEMFDGMYRACVNATDDETDAVNLKLLGEKAPFVADAIIANPPSMAHVHIAERLGIPLHIMFTFPYTPTQAFPSPLANIKPGKSNVEPNYINFMSYPLVEMMTWQGLGDIVNKFRVQTLGLEPVSSLWAPGALYRMHVPYTYMWSPSLVAKPADWGPEIDVSGFVFLDMANTFKPPQDLEDFLNAGPPPIYIGFGSIVVDDPNKFTEMIFEATKIAGVRALVNKGWGGLGADNNNTPDNIFMLDNTPHDWLFPRVKAVVHHGGAGTTAIGLKCAKPTMIIPFFGDQPFWASRVAEKKAGAHTVVPWKQLTAQKLADGIKQCLTEEAQQNVQKMAEGIEREGDGAANAVASFHRSLPLAGARTIRCSILEDRVAQWRIKGSALRLSSLAAEILMEQGKIKASDLKLLHKVSWNDFDGPGEPLTGTVGALTDSLYGIGAGVGMVPIRMARHMRKHAEHERKKAERQKRKDERKQRKQEKSQDAGEATKPADEPGSRPSATRMETNNTMATDFSAEPAQPVARELADDFHRGFKQSGWAFLTMPNDLHMAIAQGFHNAPRLWGDSTVRKPTRITGIKTGATAARHEFAYGIYDAWTGLVTLPAGGFKDGDTVPAKLVGFSTGIGKGLGGFVMKNISAVISPPAYIGKGLFVYIKKHSSDNGPGSKLAIRRAHLVQGTKDLQALQQQDDAEQQEQLQRIEHQVLEGWRVYEDIWQTAYDMYGPVGGGLVNRIKLNKEKRRWQKAGALENINTANRALKHAKRGDDLEAHFARRMTEMRQAEAPKLSAMDDTVDDTTNVPPGGGQKLTTYATEEAEDKKLEQESRTRSESSTVVATSEDDDKRGRKSSLEPARGKVDHGELLKKIGSGGKGKPIMSRMTTA